jgi:hypothetical protein
MNAFPQTMQDLLALPYNEIPSYNLAVEIFNDVSLDGVIQITAGHNEEYKYKPVFMYQGQQVSIAATYSVRQAKKLIYWYIKLKLAGPDDMTDMDDMIDSQVFLDKSELDKVYKAIKIYGHTVNKP